MKQDDFYKVSATAINLMFKERYFQHVQLLREQGMSLEAVYEEIDTILTKNRLPNRYNNYPSFRNAYYLWIKTKLQK